MVNFFFENGERRNWIFLTCHLQCSAKLAIRSKLLLSHKYSHDQISVASAQRPGSNFRCVCPISKTVRPVISVLRFSLHLATAASAPTRCGTGPCAPPGWRGPRARQHTRPLRRREETARAAAAPPRAAATGTTSGTPRRPRRLLQAAIIGRLPAGVRGDAIGRVRLECHRPLPPALPNRFSCFRCMIRFDTMHFFTPGANSIQYDALLHSRR